MRPDDWDWDSLRRRCLRETRRILRDGGEAEDIAQDAIARAWRSRAACRDPDAPAPWVVAIARNEALRHLAARRGRTSAELSSDFGDPGADRQLEALIDRLDVREALRGGTLHDRRLLLLRYGLDLSSPQIARLLGMPEATARVQLHRARIRLRRKLAP